jgi:ribonuclease P/MRP protein subunit POP5
MGLRTLPSMRESRRYIVFRVLSEDRVGYDQVRDALWNSMTHWIGEAGLARAGVRLIKNLWSQGEQTGFIQVSPKHVDAVKVAMSLIHQIGDQRVIFQSVRVSGTIKSGKEKTRPPGKAAGKVSGKAGKRKGKSLVKGRKPKRKAGS